MPTEQHAKSHRVAVRQGNFRSPCQRTQIDLRQDHWPSRLETVAAADQTILINRVFDRNLPTIIPLSRVNTKPHPVASLALERFQSESVQRGSPRASIYLCLRSRHSQFG